MTQIRWRKAIDGKFDNPHDWAGGVVPGAADDAILHATRRDFTVTAGSATIDGIQLGARAVLSIAGGDFVAREGTGAGANAGLIEVQSRAKFSVGGVVDNAGAIMLEGAGQSLSAATSLAIVSDTTLTGGGSVILSGANFDQIAGHGVTLTNVDGTIAGAGFIGSRSAGMVVVNQARGVIDADQGGGAFIALEAIHGRHDTLSNSGLLEAEGDSRLILAHEVVNGAHGRIRAGAGAAVEIDFSTVGGQRLAIKPGGALDLDGAAIVSAAMVANTGTIDQNGADSALTAPGIHNAGALVVDGGILALDGPVTGNGRAIIDGGTLDFEAAFDQNVALRVHGGGHGVLELADSRDYGGAVRGFSAKGTTTFDLRDIAFVGSGEATFSGTSSGGVLTVADGTHTAAIHLRGSYLTATFVASSDGDGGVDVVAEPVGGPPPPHRFIAAMAAVAGAPTGPASPWDARAAPATILAGPHTQFG